MVEVMAAAMDTTNGNWLAWLIGGGLGTVTAPVVVWRIWAWLRKRASLSATIKIGEEDRPMMSDPFSQQDCNSKHEQIESQLKDIHVAMDDGFARITDRLDRINTRTDTIFEHLLKEKDSR